MKNRRSKMIGAAACAGLLCMALAATPVGAASGAEPCGVSTGLAGTAVSDAAFEVASAEPCGAVTGTVGTAVSDAAFEVASAVTGTVGTAVSDAAFEVASAATGTAVSDTSDEVARIIRASNSAGETGYTYTVRIFAGSQGTVGGQETITYSGLHYGDRIVFSQDAVSVKDGSKYYVRGIRMSGRDNDQVNAAASFEVTEDADYVVAYGLRGNMVAYTVHYEDAAGGQLADPQTFYGNVGDQPVVAFQYIDGYQPQAYNLTKTLSENEQDNVFTFVYSAYAGAGASETPAPEGTAQAEGAGTEGASEEEGAADADAEGAADEDEEAAGGEAGEGEPQELVNLDEEDVPLANTDLGAEDGNGSAVTSLLADFADRLMMMPASVKAAILVCFAAAVFFLWQFILWRRRKGKNGYTDKFA